MKKHTIGLLTLIFSSLFCYGQSWVWGKQGKASNKIADEGWSIARDGFGNIYITGWFQDTLVLGLDTLKTNVFNSTDVFLAKYDMNGKVIWARQSTVSSGISSGLGYSVVTDRSGNAYITGFFAKNISFGSYNLTQLYTNGDVFLVKYDPLGNVKWAKQSICRNSAFGMGNSVSTDKMNNIYLTGQFSDSITFDSYKLGSTHYNVFIAKFDSNGNTLWANAPTNSSSFTTSGYSVASDSNGNAYITGTFNDTLHFGLTTLETVSSNNEYFLVKYDSSGNVVWAQQSTNSTAARGNAITIDKNGYIYTTGYYSGASVFGSIHLPSASTDDVFLAKYSAGGNIKWIRNAKNTTATGFAVTTDNNSKVYLSAGGNNIIFGSDTFKISKATDPLALIKFDSSGNCLCGSIIASGGDDFSGIVADPLGNYVYLGGDLEDIVTFGPNKIGPTPYTTTEWMFLAKWKPCTNVGESINEVPSQKNFISLFPNPNAGKFFLRVESEKVKNIEIYNMLGEKVFSETLRSAQSNNLIELSGQPNGVYLYRVLDNTGALLGDGKFVIEK